MTTATTTTAAPTKTTAAPTKTQAAPAKTSGGFFASFFSDLKTYFQDMKFDALFFIIGLVMLIGSVSGSSIVEGAAALAAGA